MNKILTAFVFVFLLALTGCNGSSGENDTGVDLTPNSISLSIINADGETQQSFNVNDIITLSALVLDENGRRVSNKSVSFSVGIGSLTPSSKLTNADGIAIVTVTNSDLALGAATATATISELMSEKDYEYLSSGDDSQLTSMSTQLLVNGDEVNQFKSDQLVTISTTLKNSDGEAVDGEIVTFTADIGNLKTASAMTINGIAHTTLTSDDDNIGAGVITATLASDSSSTPLINRLNYEILPSDTSAINDEIRLGYFNADNEFIEGEIQLSLPSNTISAGGTLGLSVDLVDSTNSLINSPALVTFSSNCVQSNQANIDDTVYSIKGSAKATYEDVACAGTSGTQDLIIASITVNGLTNTATANINISGEQLGSIEFVSAEPESIVLKGTGGQETSTLTFMVKSDLGNLLTHQEVEFTLNTNAGGITLSRTSGHTNSQGLITTQVAAGTVPTAVRVSAKALMTVDGNEVSVQTQSDLLSVNTGLPEQRSLTIAANPLNPEASLNGTTSEISVWLADNFNNPVPDGTTVNFTTEGGVIEPSCVTTAGYCTVTWTSAQPRVDDHRVTILATAVGHETFFDTNGNNTFDNDGDAIVSQEVSSGRGRFNAQASGFIDMSEAWRDDNENNLYDSGEVFLDFNNDQLFTLEDDKFNGPQCQGDKCSSSNSIHVRKSLTLIMSSSSASYVLFNGATIFEDSIQNIANDIPSIARGANQSLTFLIGDSVGQAMPEGTTVAISTTAGELIGVTNTTIANTNRTTEMNFSINNPADGDADTGFLTFTITSPSGVITSLYKAIDLL